MYKPRVIRTTTPYKPNESNKLSGNKGKLNFNFNDINKFKRVEIPSKTDEKYQMNGTMKPLSKNEKIQEGSLQLPPIGNFSDEKLTFTGTFNPRKFEKTGIFKKDASPRKKQEIYTKTGYFKMGDVATVKGVFAMQANNYSAGSEGIEKFENSKQKNAGKFPKDVFATNVKRKFFV